MSLTTVKVLAEMEAAFMASLKVAVILRLVATFEEPGAGSVSTTVGRVVSVSGAGVKLTLGVPSIGSRLPPPPPPPQPLTRAVSKVRIKAIRYFDEL